MWGKGRENLCLICIKMGAFWVWFGLLLLCEVCCFMGFGLFNGGNQ